MSGQAVLQITAEGRRADAAQGCEVIIIGWLCADSSVRFDLNHFDGNWEELRDADLGSARRTPLAVKSEGGTAEWPLDTITALDRPRLHGQRYRGDRPAWRHYWRAPT